MDHYRKSNSELDQVNNLELQEVEEVEPLEVKAVDPLGVDSVDPEEAKGVELENIAIESNSLKDESQIISESLSIKVNSTPSANSGNMLAPRRR